MPQSLSVILMIIFTFSKSLATLASESSSWQLEVKTAAEHDANSDINKAIWYTIGVGTSAACCFGAYTGFVIAENLYPSVSGYVYEPEGVPPKDKECLGASIPYTMQFLGSLVGASACGGFSFLGIYENQSNPPCERFIGKSPEYVEYYMAVYTAKARSIRIKSAAAGTATGCGFVGLVYLWALNSGL